MLRTRSPRAHILYCYRMLRVRLACVKHAASVRSEPGSNSRLKPDVSTVPAEAATIGTNCLNRSVFISTSNTKQKILKLLLSRYTRNKRQNQTGSGLFHPIVKEQVLPGQQEGLQTNPDATGAFPFRQAQITNFYGKHLRDE